MDMETGEIIDYFNGLTDIKNKLIRHVNAEHFIEDPLRVLRGIRQSCQLDFMIAEDTVRLCTDMVHKGMLSALTPERVWKEMEKALYTKKFYLFIHYLDVMDALSVILPEVAELKNVPENTDYHPEGNAYKHVLLTLKEVNNYDKEGKDLALINFALLCHDLGKALTDKTEWPAHHNHDDLGLSLIDGLCERLKVPNDYRDFAKLFCKNHMKFYNFLERSVKTQYDNIEEITKFKDEHKLNLVQICHACDKLGREGFVKEERIDIMLRVFTRQNIIFTILKDIGLKDLPKETQEHLNHFKGEKFGKLYRDAKISYLKGKLHERV
jgi:tRNA nucleotidyltransferase (CCA-adding enzyme)